MRGFSDQLAKDVRALLGHRNTKNVVPQSWQFWGTTLWAIAVVATFEIVGALLVGLAIWLNPKLIPPGANLSADDFRLLLQSRGLEIFGAAGACSFGVLALAIRFTRIGIQDYLGLIPARARDIGAGLAGLVIINFTFGFLAYLSSASTSFMFDLYQGSKAEGSLALMLVGVVLAAPLAEELLVRGFLFRGWANSRLGSTGAILLTSAVWTSLHIQYGWLGLSAVFCMGLLFGWIRQRSGSTTTTIILHVAQNAWAVASVAALSFWRLM